MARTRRLSAALIFSVIFVISLTSCEYWNKDWKGYLEYWSTTVQVGRVEKSGATFQKNDSGIDTIPVAATPTLVAVLINPHGFALDATKGTTSDSSVIIDNSSVESFFETPTFSDNNTLLSVKLRAGNDSLEHQTFTATFAPVRTENKVSVAGQSVTLRYNTPPRTPLAIVWDVDASSFSLLESGAAWQPTTSAGSDKDGYIYWGWPQGNYVGSGNYDETAADCVSQFSINGTVHKASDLLIKDTGGSVKTFTSGSATYDIYGYKVGSGVSVSLHALDSEGIAGTSLHSGVAPYTITLNGNGVTPWKETQVTTLYAKWKVNVDFNLDGGTVADGSTTRQLLDSGDKVTKPSVPTKAGWIFTWWKDGTGNAYDFTKPVTAPLTLTANWVQEMYVHAGNGDDNNGGTQAAPVATVNKALEKIYAVNDGTSMYTIIMMSDFTMADLSAKGYSQSGAEGHSSMICIDDDTTLNLTLKSVDENKFTIDAQSSDTETGADPNNQRRVLFIAGDARVTLENIRLTGGNQTEGGAIRVRGELVMNTGAVVTKNKGGWGPCIFIYNGTFTMNDGEISYNETTHLGGGVTTWKAGKFYMKGGEICYNKARNGGGVYLEGEGFFEMSGGDIHHNEATGVTQDNTTIGAEGSGSGGGVFSKADWTMTNGTIRDNQATDKGGGVFVYAGTFTMTGGEISGNTASQDNNVGKLYGTFNHQGGNVLN